MPPNSMLPSSPPSANPAMPPMIPPNKLGRGRHRRGAAALSERDGLDGVVGDAGARAAPATRTIGNRDCRRCLRAPTHRALTRTSDSRAIRLGASIFRVFTLVPPPPGSGVGPFSRNEQHFTGGLAALQRAMGLGGVLERELVLGAQLELAVPDPAEQLARAREQLVAGDDVVIEARAREEQRALGVEHLESNGPMGPLDWP